MTMTTPDPRLDGNLIHLAIQNGLCDDSLDMLIESARGRQRLLADRKAVMLEPGDRFYVTNISPKKLSGTLVEFKGRDKDGWLICEIISYVDANRYRRGSELLLRNTHVGTVES